MNKKYKVYDRVGDIVPHNLRYGEMDFEMIEELTHIKSQLQKLYNYEVQRTGTSDMIAFYIERAVEYCNKMISEAEERISGK